jgi:hypothetical protein
MPLQTLLWNGAEFVTISGGKTNPLPPPPSGSTRDELGEYGTYKPTYADVGLVSAAILSPHNSPNVDTYLLPPGGGKISNRIVYGDIVPNSDGAKWWFENCLNVGGNHAPGSDVGIFTGFKNRAGSNVAAWTDTGNVHFTDCEFRPRRRVIGRNGAVGHNFTLERCLVTGGTVDAVSSHTMSGSTNVGTWAKVKVLGSILEKTAYTYPDTITTTHSDGTHNDLWQHQGGDAIVAIGNWFNGAGDGYTSTSAAYPQFPWMPERWVAGAGLLVQANGSMAKTTAANSEVRDNWFNGGKFHLVFHSGCEAQLSGNKHSVDVARRGPNTSLGSNYNGVAIWISAGDGSFPGINGGMTSTTLDGPYAGQPLVQTSLSGWTGVAYSTPNWPAGMTDASGITY